MDLRKVQGYDMKPILFNTEMVKALLDGRKTVTRRVVKPKYSNTHFEFKHDKYGTTFIELQNDVEGETHGKNEDDSTWHKLLGFIEPKAPYKVGDILYVRETWQCLNPYSEKEYVYRAGCDFDFAKDIDKWLPSIHMPKEAARFFLKVTGVRAEKLQDMDHDSPAKEGIRGYTKDGELYKFAVSDDWWIEYHGKHKKEFKGTYWQDMPKNRAIAFSYLWNSTILKEDMNRYGWDANPWVWVIEFEMISKEDAYAISGNVL